MSGGTGAGSPRSPAASSSLAWAALLGSGVLYGYNWVVMKSALRYESSAAFAASRVLGGAVFLFLLLLVLRRPLRPTNWPLTVLIGLFGMTGSIGLAVWALASGGAGKTSVLVYSMPVWLLLMSWFILGERVRGTQWLSVAVALIGLVFVVSPWKPEGSALGNILAVAAGVCSAASAITAKILFRDHRVDLLTLNAWQMLFGAIPLRRYRALDVEPPFAPILVPLVRGEPPLQCHLRVRGVAAAVVLHPAPSLGGHCRARTSRRPGHRRRCVLGPIGGAAGSLRVGRHRSDHCRTVRPGGSADSRRPSDGTVGDG